MKTLKVALILLFAGYAVSAQIFEYGSNLSFSQPAGAMATNMNNAFGLSMNLSRQFKAPFSAGIELSYGSYGFHSSRQTYTFDDGSVTETDVNVSNNILNLHLTGKHFLRNGKNINPYLSGKAGWSWFSTVLAIEDPADEFSCHPIESDILARDNTYSFSGGAGVRIDFNSIFKTEKGRLFFDFSVHATRGGIVKHMNVEKNSAQPPPNQDIMAKFINTQTQVVHEHHVGYLYNSVLNMVDYKLGVVFRPGQIH